MAFKKLKDFNEERYGNMFLLRNDGDYADVIFLYQSEDDVLVADTHYIKSADYNGYVHCCGKRCPACTKGIRVQTKLFIPLYNISAKEIQFWDRNSRFEGQLNQDVLSKFPNPSEFVFRIIRHGVTGSVDTTYEIKPIGRNSIMSYSDILSSMNVTFPDYYSCICKEYDRTELEELINMPVDNSYDNIPDYSVTPRNSATPVFGTAESDKVPVPEIDNIEPFESDDSDDNPFEDEDNEDTDNVDF